MANAEAHHDHAPYHPDLSRLHGFRRSGPVDDRAHLPTPAVRFAPANVRPARRRVERRIIPPRPRNALPVEPGAAIGLAYVEAAPSLTTWQRERREGRMLVVTWLAGMIMGLTIVVTALVILSQ